MYGLIVKLTVLPGTREKMISILKASASCMPECLSYVVAEESTDQNVLWVTEVWDSQASHDAVVAGCRKECSPTIQSDCFEL